MRLNMPFVCGITNKLFGLLVIHNNLLLDSLEVFYHFLLKNGHQLQYKSKSFFGTAFPNALFQILVLDVIESILENVNHVV